MVPTNKELEKVFKLYMQYTKLGVYVQQRKDLFDYIRENWDD